jgi:hypothetical protein
LQAGDAIALKSPGQHRRRRHESDVGVGLLVQVGALVAAEEEQLVPQNRAAKRAAELAALQAIVLAFAVRQNDRKPVGRVEAAVAIELEEIAVKLLVPTWSPR